MYIRTSIFTELSRTILFLFCFVHICVKKWNVKMLGYICMMKFHVYYRSRLQDNLEKYVRNINMKWRNVISIYN